MTAKTKRVSIKLSAQEFTQLKEKADHAGLTLSAYVRHKLIYQVLEKYKTTYQDR